MLWASVNGIPLAFNLIKNLAEADIGTIWVFSNDEEILEYGRELGILYHRLYYETHQEDNEYLPAGGVRSLSYICEKYEYDYSEVLCLLDYRYPMLSVDRIRAASQQCNQGKSDLIVSVSPPEDHPAQCNSYYRVESLEMMGLVLSDVQSCSSDPTAQDEGLLCLLKQLWGHKHVNISRSFPFDWKSLGIDPVLSEHRLFHMKLGPSKINMVPVGHDNQFKPKDLRNLQPIYYYENHDTAKCVFPNELPTFRNIGKVCGFPLYGPLKNCSFLLTFKQTPEKLDIYLCESLIAEQMRMRIWPVSDGGKVGKCRDYQLTSEFVETLGRYEANNRTFLGPVERLDVHEWLNNLIISMLSYSTDGYAEYSEPFQTDMSPWKWVSTTDQLINRDNGKVITGRQDLPEILKPDGAFIIFRGTNSVRPSWVLDLDNAIGFRISAVEARKICTQLDLLRLYALMKGAASVP